MTHPAGVALFHPEHNHWHQSAVADVPDHDQGDPYTGATPEWQPASKITFCFVDVEFIGLTGTAEEGVAADVLRVQRRPPGARGGLG